MGKLRPIDITSPLQEGSWLTFFPLCERLADINRDILCTLYFFSVLDILFCMCCPPLYFGVSKLWDLRSFRFSVVAFVVLLLWFIIKWVHCFHPICWFSRIISYYIMWHGTRWEFCLPITRAPTPRGLVRKSKEPAVHSTGLPNPLILYLKL